METKNETSVTTEAATVVAPKEWWAGKFVLSTSEEVKDGQRIKSGIIYRVIAIEGVRAVCQFVIADGTVTITSFPLRFIPIEIMTGNIDRKKTGLRMFDGYDAAVNFARLSGAALSDDSFSEVEKKNLSSIARGEKPTEAPAPTMSKAARRRRNA